VPLSAISSPARARRTPPPTPYAKYLLTTQWTKKRQAALRRAGSRCQICNAEKRLDVHHRTYDRLGAEVAADLIVLCRACHKLFHQKRRLVK
jgi:5-methylcytosine-specific restriction endonuclease McrA